jgi:hypothetical protein
VGDPDSTFASRSVPEHLLRGAVGLPMLVLAFVLVGSVGPLSLLLLVPAVVLLRGCPTCWALGLVQTRERERCSTGRCGDRT